MKKILMSFVVLTTVLSSIIGCAKEENKTYLESGTTPVLSATATNLALSFLTKDNPITTLNWTNPNYRFTTGIASNNVVYQLEIDKASNNFNGAGKRTFRIENDLMQAFTVGSFNDILLNDLQLPTGVSTTVSARVTSTLGGSNAKLTSNVITFTCTPYVIPPKVPPPASGQLFITGAATGGWMAGGDSPTSATALAKKFTQISPTLYELPSIAITGGNEYLFVPVYGDWSNKFGYTGNTADCNPAGDDIRDGGNNFKGPGISGNYKVTVDFQRGKFTFTKL